MKLTNLSKCLRGNGAAETLHGDSNAAAWAFFQSQPAWYRRTAGHWVMEAKREETRRKRLATLIEDSAQGKTIGPLTRNKKEG